MKSKRGGTAISRCGVVGMLLAILCVGCTEEQPRIAIESARAELSAGGAGGGRVYLRIRNDGGADAVTGIRTSMAGATARLVGTPGAGAAKGAVLPVAARSTAELRSAGAYIMIENLPKEAVNGFAFTLTLVFERSGERTLPLTLLSPARTGTGVSDGRGMSVRD